jgi:hypothetical protein
MVLRGEGGNYPHTVFLELTKALTMSARPWQLSTVHVFYDRAVFDCDFDVIIFPFDSQVCNIQITLQRRQLVTVM